MKRVCEKALDPDLDLSFLLLSLLLLLLFQSAEFRGQRERCDKSEVVMGAESVWGIFTPRGGGGEGGRLVRVE